MPSLYTFNDEFPKGAHREFSEEEDAGKWFDRTPKTREELEAVSSETETGSRTLSPCIHTNYIEFKLDEPNGMAIEATCNDCWNTFWSPPFRSVVECPFCHAGSGNIHTEEVIGGE